MSEFDLNFDKAFKIPLSALKALGSYPFRSVQDRKAKFLAIVFVTTTVTYISLFSYSLIQTAKARDFTETCRTGYMISLCICVLFKYLILVLFHKNVAVLIEMINEDYEVNNQRSAAAEKDIVVEYVKKSQWLCKAWRVIAFGSGSLFGLKACVYMSFSSFQGSFQPAMIAPVISPPFIRSLGVTADLLFVWCWQLMFVGFTTMVYTGCEATGPIFILHACGQLNLVETKIMQFYSNLSDPRGVQEKMAECTQMLQKVYRFIKEINLIYNVHYEVVIKCSVVAIPVGSFLIITTWKDAPNFEFMTLIVGSFIQVYLPCYYSDMLIDKAENVRQALYACNWEEHPESAHRRTLLNLMVRATQPPVIRSIFTIICLAAFAEMCRQAFTLFNIMNVLLT